MDQIEAVVPGSGEIVLQLDPTLTFTRADVRVIRVDADRPVVIQVFSYPVDKPIVDYPCVIVRALADATDASFTDASPTLHLGTVSHSNASCLFRKRLMGRPGRPRLGKA